MSNSITKKNKCFVRISKKQNHVLTKSMSRSKKSPVMYGGSKIYADGMITDIDETYNGKSFFRKKFNNSIPLSRNEIISIRAERKIASILQKNPHPNIVTYYAITDTHIDMEELDVITPLDKIKMIDIMKNVKDFLQKLGIMYIDWKKDNIGISSDRTYKLFDFDVSGVISLKTNKWIVKPVEYWSYTQAIKKGCKTPKEIDDWSFDYGL